jgi:hypothetical protein
VHLADQDENRRSLAEHGMRRSSGCGVSACSGRVSSPCTRCTSSSRRSIFWQPCRVDRALPFVEPQLASGFAPVERCAARANLCLGTDGAASNNRLISSGNAHRCAARQALARDAQALPRMRAARRPLGARRRSASTSAPARSPQERPPTSSVAARTELAPCYDPVASSTPRDAST